MPTEMPTKVETHHAAGALIAKGEKHKQGRCRRRKSRVPPMPRFAARQRGTAKMQRRKEAR